MHTACFACHQTASACASKKASSTCAGGATRTRSVVKSSTSHCALSMVCIDNRGMGSQPKAYLDHTFLKSEEARPIRILAEYLEPQRRFKLQNIQDTVVFFGSARIHSREAAQQALEELMKLHGVASSREVDEILARGRRAVEWSRYYEEARELAHMLTEWSTSLNSPHHRFVVTSGGGPGIMEAANRGAAEAGG